MLRDRMLGGVSPLVLYALDGAGSGGGDGGAGNTAGAAGSGTNVGAGGADAGATGKPVAGAGGAADKTLAGGGPGADVTAAASAPAKFPDQWRELLAGGDAAAAKDLAKYTDPTAVYKSLRSLQADISSGKLKAPAAPLPENATDEQKAAHRTANGLPDKPDAYVGNLALPNGVVLGEADKPLVGDFAKLALDKGWSQSQFNDAVGWFYEAQAAQEELRAEADGQSRVAAEVELRGEWGPQDFRANMNAVGSVLAMMPDDLRNEVLTARTPSGQLVGNTAAFNRWAAALGRELNPAATLVPLGDGNAVKTIGAELAALEAKMADHRSDYWRGPSADAQQARYRELIDAQQKMQNRGRAA